MEKRSKSTLPRKILRGRVFYILFWILFADNLGNKNRQPHEISRSRVLY